MARQPVRNTPAKQVLPRLTADFADLLRSLARSVLDPYRPELHYMRGPGPKWHAKHDAVTVQLNRTPALARIRVKG